MRLYDIRISVVYPGQALHLGSKNWHAGVNTGSSVSLSVNHFGGTMDSFVATYNIAAADVFEAHQQFNNQQNSDDHKSDLRTRFIQARCIWNNLHRCFLHNPLAHLPKVMIPPLARKARNIPLLTPAKLVEAHAAMRRAAAGPGSAAAAGALRILCQCEQPLDLPDVDPD